MRLRKVIFGGLLALVLVCTTIILPVRADGADIVQGKCSDTISWTLNKTSGEITISGTGDMPDYESGETPWYRDRMSIKTIRVENGVTGVGDYAFSYSINATSVTLANSVTVIGSHAFFACYELASLEMAGVKVIEDHAFSNCHKSLANFAWPANLTKIGDYAFYSCSRLENPDFSEALTAVGEYAFAYCNSITELTLPASLREIGDYTFDSCLGLRRVTLPDSMTRMSAFMFRGCSALTQIVLPEQLTSISPYAFADCVNLVWVWIPDGVVAIGESAFECCSRMERILLPGSVVSIGKGAFYHCLNLSSVGYFGSEEAWRRVSIKTYNEPLLDAEITFDPQQYTTFTVITPVSCTKNGVLEYVVDNGASRTETLQALGHTYEKDDGMTWVCSTCGDTVTVPAGTLGYGSCGPNLTWILSGDGTLTVSGEGRMINVGVRTSAPWYDLRESIRHVVVESGVTYLGQEAFTYCTKLKDVTLPDTMTEIGENAFSACYILEDVKLPAQLTTLDDHAFFGCYTLPRIAFPAALTSIGEYAFYNCESLADPQFPAGLVSIEQWAFAYCDTFSHICLPEGLERLGDYAFDSCLGLQTAELPENLTYLGMYAFRGCELLENVNIPEHITTIGQNTFDGCITLRVVVLPKSIKSIGQAAFYNCTALKDLLLYTGNCSFSNAVFTNTPKDFTIWSAPSSPVEMYAKRQSISFGNVADHPLYDEPKHEHFYLSKVVLPEKGVRGCTLYTCTVCGDRYEENYIPAPYDVNKDRRIDDVDLTMLVRYVARIEPIADKPELTCLDFDDSGSVDARDVTILAQYLESSK